MCCQQFQLSFSFDEYEPVTYVAIKIIPKGNHVPRTLLNISKLLFISKATIKTSRKTTIDKNENAVCIGLV